MKSLPILASAALMTVSQAQTLNWGNDFFGYVENSAGANVDTSYVFELGSFANGFIPNETNTASWLANWQVFDSTSYNPGNGYFTSTVYIENGVTSSNPSASTQSFAGMDAFIWIRKGDDPVEGSEWLLARAQNWIFPLTGGDCCNTDVVEWSVNDLTGSDIPKWGRQSGVNGPGTYTSSGSSGLQTFTFIPEPSSMLLAGLAGVFLMTRRRRELMLD